MDEMNSPPLGVYVWAWWHPEEVKKGGKKFTLYVFSQKTSKGVYVFHPKKSTGVSLLKPMDVLRRDIQVGKFLPFCIPGGAVG